MLWIMAFHSQVYFGDSGPGMPLNFWKQSGFGGADIFFFLSGFGLVHGWVRRRPSTATFYAGRVRRVLPAFWLLVVADAGLSWAMGSSPTLTTLATRLVGVDYLVFGDDRFWFVPSIAVCYAAFPWLMGLASEAGTAGPESRRPHALLVLATAFALAAVTLPVGHLYLLVARVPVFVLGVFVGIRACRSTEDSQRAWPWPQISVGVAVLGLLVLWIIQMSGAESADESFQSGGLLLFLPLAPALVIVAASAFAWLEDRGLAPGALGWIRGGLAFIGRNSLELYLIHVSLFETLGPQVNAGLQEALPTAARGNLLACVLLSAVSLALAAPVARFARLFRANSVTGRP